MRQLYSKNNETTVNNDSTAVVNEVSFFGEYEGTLPAADCEGIKTTLTVNSDSTYTLKSEYIGIKDGTFETSGVYKMPNDSLLELITPSSGEKTYYRIIDNEKVMLSDEKKELLTMANLPNTTSFLKNRKPYIIYKQ